MKTVLFIVSSTRHSCKGRLEGIFRYAVKRGWHVQVVERAFREIDVREVMGYWNPIGVIAECGSMANELTRRSFGKIPVVYFDRDPRLCKDEMAVMLDSTKIGEMAAKELLSLGLENFAYVPARLPTFWCKERGRSFAVAIRAMGKNYCQFVRSYKATQVEQAKALDEWLLRIPKPCGIFAANDNTASMIAMAAERCHIKIPSQIALLGVDNDEQICENTIPSLSSIAPDFAGGGFMAAKLLGSMLASDTVERKVHKFEASCIVRRASTLYRGESLLVTHSAVVARGLDFIFTDAGRGICVNDVVRAMGIARCTAEIMFRQATNKTILTAINDRIYELAKEKFAKGRPTVRSVAEQLAVSRNTLDRIFIRRTGSPAGLIKV